MPLAFAPVGWGWLAVIALAAFFFLSAQPSKRQAQWSAYLFGLGYFGVGVSWVFVSISQYGNGPFVAVLATSAFVLLLALFPWCVTCLVRSLRPEMDAGALWLGLPAAWVLSEWMRTWLLTGFPWLFVGYSQTDTTLANIAPVFGVLGVSFFVALLAGGLAWVALGPGLRRAVVAAAVLSVALASSQLLDRTWTEPVAGPVSVVLLQGNIAQDKKWDPNYREATLERYQALTMEHLGVDIIIWPEAAVPMWYDQAQEYLSRLETLADRSGTSLMIGALIRKTEGPAYNAVVSLSEPPAFYYKRHLVPFGEYVPFRNFLGSAFDVLGAPMSDFTPGTTAHVLQAAGIPVGTIICYEAVFGDEVADFLPEAQLLVNISNDAWFGGSIGPFQHFQMVRMRAIETERDLLRATNTGITAAVSFEGEILKRAPQFSVSAINVEVTPRTGATPYVRWRDWPVLGLITIGLGLLLLNRMNQRWVSTRRRRSTNSR
ncbi:MAG TPA: apolipoprotein N-acyltransferase [Pseudomonas xinjiangensis]|uniref:Apolipoprotein N-acyltransferase n=2 Tax=root TaxID=1 RepID=A0A7V1FU25_9GAMM|nr:apolipoprotein N-acyltransferase [Halopseudomonas xinjiangensis]HEC46562.1 apolipoprotein N-acyltransferase [Halopseudomonas xinjiangensis]